MRTRWPWPWIIAGCLSALSILSCVPQEVTTKPSVYYVTPVITYLKEYPRYDCKVVGELYRADRLEQLEAKGNWWRVRLKGGTLTGWLQKELVSATPVPAIYYYVAADSLELRDCPSPDCPFRKILFKGDMVQKIDSNGQGWVRVLVEKDASIGWIPADQVTDRAIKAETTPAAKKVYYYAAGPEVALHSLPLFSSKVVKSVHLDEKLEKLAQLGHDWYKVRHPESGAEGWVAARYLKTSPAAKEPLKKKRRFRRKRTPKPVPLPEPEAM